MTIEYEWKTEALNAQEDITKVTYFSTLEHALREMDLDLEVFQVALVRTTFNSDDVQVDRQHAYLRASRLPPKFDGGAVVPQRFRREAAQAMAERQ